MNQGRHGGRKLMPVMTFGIRRIYDSVVQNNLKHGYHTVSGSLTPSI
jgi:hypothetical protein